MTAGELGTLSCKSVAPVKLYKNKQAHNQNMDSLIKIHQLFTYKNYKVKQSFEFLDDQL